MTDLPVPPGLTATYEPCTRTGEPQVRMYADRTEMDVPGEDRVLVIRAEAKKP